MKWYERYDMKFSINLNMIKKIFFTEKNIYILKTFILSIKKLFYIGGIIEFE